MKAFMGLCGVLAIASPSLCQTVCTTDDVILSLLTVEYYAVKMQSVVDSEHNNINPSELIYQNFLTQTNHLNQDLQCSVTAAPAEQLSICSSYESFAFAQLNYLHAADGVAFYQQNGNVSDAAKMHGYILLAESALENYTSKIKAAASSCVNRIDTAYEPLGAQLVHLLQIYPGTA